MALGNTACGRVRYTVLLMLFAATTINYADRMTLSIAGSSLQSQLGVNDVALGYLFSAFGWTYVVAQIPAGWLLDRFGSRIVYAGSILLWSLLTLLQGTVAFLSGAAAIAVLFGLRLLLGLAESPAFPGNCRITAAWFPAQERATAVGIFNSAQYASTLLFAPLMAWITHRYGWRQVFYFMGALGFLVWASWLMTVYGPRRHPRVSRSEIDYIGTHGALLEMDVGAHSPARPVHWDDLRQLLLNRMLVGVYLAQYCITTLSYFFLTWFPVYLVKERGMSILQAGMAASLPAACGLIGGVLGGVFSDSLLRHGHSLTLARKMPIVIGLLLSTSIIVCNYCASQWLVILFMSLAYFGKGVGALGWAVVTDTSPPEAPGLSGGLFNFFGNIPAIITPLVVGYIVSDSGSFAGALVFVAIHAVVAVLSYLFIVGPIERTRLSPIQKYAEALC